MNATCLHTALPTCISYLLLWWFAHPTITYRACERSRMGNGAERNVNYCQHVTRAPLPNPWKCCKIGTKPSQWVQFCYCLVTIVVNCLVRRCKLWLVGLDSLSGVSYKLFYNGRLLWAFMRPLDDRQIHNVTLSCVELSDSDSGRSNSRAQSTVVTWPLLDSHQRLLQHIDGFIQRLTQCHSIGICYTHRKTDVH